MHCSLCTFPHRKRSSNGLSIGVNVVRTHRQTDRHTHRQTDIKLRTKKLRGRCDRGCYLTCAHPGRKKKSIHLSKDSFLQKKLRSIAAFFLPRASRAAKTPTKPHVHHAIGILTRASRVPLVYRKYYGCCKAYDRGSFHFYWAGSGLALRVTYRLPC